jgi:predicted transcriptional regulator
VGEPAKSASTAELTAEIVSAYVSNNETALSDLAGLITAVANQLSRLGMTPAPVEVDRPGPAVPTRRSIQRDHLVCLVCGKPQKMLKRHLAARHELSPTEYRERFGLNPGLSDDCAGVLTETARGGARGRSREEVSSAARAGRRVGRARPTNTSGRTATPARDPGCSNQALAPEQPKRRLAPRAPCPVSSTQLGPLRASRPHRVAGRHRISAFLMWRVL